VAVIGSIVSSAYRSHLRGTLPTGINQSTAREALRSIGVATETANSLPHSAAQQLTHAANTAYVNAITHGFYVSAAIMLAALVAALALLPRRTRDYQAQSRHDDAVADFLTDPTFNEAASDSPGVRTIG